MRWLKARFHELRGPYRKGFLACIICVFLWILATLLAHFLIRNLYDQQVAKRWAANKEEYTQISCFYPVSKVLSDFEFQSLHHAVEDALTKASLVAHTENAKLFADAYSVSGKMMISTENYGTEVKVVGVSESFFLFHPIKLLAGSYFDDSMIMKDGVILDEDMAFKLYGSNDIVGMPVYIGNEPYYIRGVVERENGYFAKKAGLSEAVCYVSMETLNKHGIIEGSYTYEVVMHNPVDDFAKNIIETALNDTTYQIEVVENSSRFSWKAKKNIVLDFGLRSMSRNGIIYPYWENIARAKEDVCGLLFVLQTISLGTAVVLVGLYIKIVIKKRDVL